MKFIQQKGDSLPYVAALPSDYNGDRPLNCLILLHGYGSHMGDLASLGPSINETDYIYICPNAPIQMDLGFGQKGYAWFPIGENRTSNDLYRAVEVINATIEEALQKFPINRDRVFIGGFSQGGMIAMHAGLSKPDTFKGALILSSRIILEDELLSSTKGASKIPVFMSHGTTDNVIPISEGQHANDVLTKNGYSVEFHEYDMAHQIIDENIRDVATWISQL